MLNSPSKAKLTVTSGKYSGKEINLDQTELVIGREAPAGLILLHQEISRRHARLTFRDGSYLLEDLGSRNGTLLNGQPLQGPRVLNDCDEIQLGSQIKLMFNQQPILYVATSFEQANLTMSEGSLTSEALQASLSANPPTLQVTIAGQPGETFTLEKDSISLGRAEDNDIIVPSPIVSRHHATLVKTALGYEIWIAPGVSNTLTCQGCPITERQLLSHLDVLRIDSELPGMMVSMTYLAPSQATARLSPVQFGDKEQFMLGRDPANDVVCDDPRVSRFHAQVTRVGRRYYVTDLRSANGTFINDVRVEGNVWLKPQDTIKIGPYKLVMGQDEFTRFDETEGLCVEAYHLNKWVRKDLNLLQDISLIFQPREFIVVVGQSGGGKSTLVDAIAGYRPATHGKVFVNGIDVYQNFDAIRNDIGFVPQRDIIHMELTVYQALNFAAQLRMPKDTTPAERHKRIMEVLNDLDLTHRKDVQISGLSGGQQKRVSIGVELLTRPGLFFLDEPTSGLDPGTETAFMHLMRRLADQGRTIIMVTHATKNVMLADKVVFLARGGYVAWFGPPDEALTYFDQYRSEQDRRARPMEFDQIYAIIDDPRKGSGKEWGERYMVSYAFPKYIVEPLKTSQQQDISEQSQPARKQNRKGARISSIRQFLVLSARNVTILLRDRSSLVLALLVPLGVGAVFFGLSLAMGRGPFNYIGGSPSSSSTILFLLALFSLLVGGVSQMREFVKEADIYKRERLVNLRVFPYVSSKLWLAVVMALWQAFAYAVMLHLAFRMPGGLTEFGEFFLTMVLAVFSGMMLGLMASALSPNAASAPLTLIMMIVPLIVLSGYVAPVPPQISQVASTRWTFQSLIGITGIGSDVAADPCWHLDKNLRNSMDLDAKSYFQCTCMGVQIFKQDSCNFPSVGDFFVSEINLPTPLEPLSLPKQPPEPSIPAAPEPPADQYDQVQVVQYLNSLISYQDEVQIIQDNYRNQMDLYQITANVYASEMVKYQNELANYIIARVSAVKAAEGIIEGYTKSIGWAYVNQDDPGIYFPWLLNTWFAEIVIVAIYFVIILVLIKRKDVK